MPSVSPPPPARAWRWGAALTALTALAVTACQGTPGGGSSAYHRAAHPPPARITITSGNLTFSSVRDASAASAQAASQPAGVPVDRRPDLGLSVAVSGGTLSDVTVTTGTGQPVAGRLATGRHAWHTAWPLAPSRAYRVTATAVSPQGARSTATGTFHTLRPRHTVTAATSLGSGQTYGVGMPIMVSFSRPVKDKAAVERSLEIWSSKPVTGAWYWLSDTQAWFRPKKYWPAHTTVRFRAHLAGVRAAPGVYGRGVLTQRFRIGDSLVAVASAATHRMRVWWNGRLRGSWPVSTGRPGNDTPNGRYLSFTKGNPVVMDSATFGVMPGDPGYYRIRVNYSVQFTYSGIYVHSAPWSVAEQGVSNVSHGCVNVSPANAAWYYNRSVIGDPITVVGSPVPGTWGDGWTIWFLRWHKLLAGSGTGLAVQAGPAGSHFETVAPPAQQPRLRG
jgi:lipoprotein-anchoring transpeptidase ErfK/SrfK